VVERQRKTGIDVISDGELGKVGFSEYVLQRMSGFEGHADFMAADFADAGRSGRIRQRRLKAPVPSRRSVAEVARGAPNWPPSACGDQAA
jgi:methionine synthase II (cobalamin-independent)